MVRDWNGSFIQGYASRIQGVLHPNHVEALAVAAAMQIATDEGYTKIMLEDDSKGVINALRRRTSELSGVGKYC